jgi:phage shock protein PspC (stress-responsive transcriptional regulator)
MADMSDVNGGPGDASSAARSDTSASSASSEANGFGAYPGRGPASARRLERKREGRWVAGVCAGLGDYLNVDPTVVRVIVVVLAVFGGLGPLAYVVGWVLMPEEGDQESIAERVINSSGRR